MEFKETLCWCYYKWIHSFQLKPQFIYRHLISFSHLPKGYKTYIFVSLI
jgi:hypothetical protein